MESREYSSYTCRYLWGWAGVVFPASTCIGVGSIAYDANIPTNMEYLSSLRGKAHKTLVIYKII